MFPLSYIDAGTIAIFIPIISILGGILIAITAVIINGRTKDLEHRERIIAMEKGIALPDPPPPKKRKPVYSSRRAGGLVLTGIGLALWIAITVSEGSRDGIWGLIPMAIGLGLLIAAMLDKREYDAEMAKEEAQSRQVAERPTYPTDPTYPAE